jgi:hypothetical protein
MSAAKTLAHLVPQSDLNHRHPLGATIYPPLFCKIHDNRSSRARLQDRILEPRMVYNGLVAFIAK